MAVQPIESIIGRDHGYQRGASHLRVVPELPPEREYTTEDLFTLPDVLENGQTQEVFSWSRNNDIVTRVWRNPHDDGCTVLIGIRQDGERLVLNPEEAWHEYGVNSRRESERTYWLEDRRSDHRIVIEHDLAVRYFDHDGRCTDLYPFPAEEREKPRTLGSIALRSHYY